jgi:ComEC/Rec2-related protein
MLVLSLRARSLRRTFATWRRHAPAVQLAFAVMLGQGIVWLLEDLWLAIALTLLGLGCCASWARGVSWLTGGALAGVVSAFLALPTPARTLTLQGERALQGEVALQGELALIGVVAVTPRHPRPGEVTFELKSDAELGGALIRCRSIDLPWRNAAILQPGDRVLVRGLFEPVSRPLNPFSWEGWLWRKGVRAECKARFVSRPIERVPTLLYVWREYVHHRVVSAVGESQGSGLFLSMALGYHDLLSVPLEKAFTRLGLTHLLVVSGYQVSLAFGFILWCTTAIVRRLRYGGRYVRSTATVLAFASSALYVVFIGFEMSAVRALLAAACVCAHLLSERGTSFAQRWGVALLGMQLLWPWCAFDIGMVLTFAALFGIGLGSEVAARSKIAGFVAVTSAVWLCTSLIIVVWQGTISPLGLVLNLVVAAPWSIINCTVGLSALGIMLLGFPGSAYPLWMVGVLNQCIGEIVLALGEWPYASWDLEGALRVGVIVVVATCVLGLMYRFTSSQRVRLSA